EHVRDRIVGAGEPGPRPSFAPRVPRPSLVATDSRLGNRHKTPTLLPRVDIVGSDKRAAGSGRSAHARNDEVLVDQRRATDIRPGILPDGHFPQHFARGGRQSRQSRIPRTDEDPIAEQGDTPVLPQRALAAALKYVGMI